MAGATVTRGSTSTRKAKQSSPAKGEISQSIPEGLVCHSASWVFLVAILHHIERTQEICTVKTFINAGCRRGCRWLFTQTTFTFSSLL